jgi:hypothetical protein
MAVSLSSKNLWSRQSNIPVGESEALVIDSIFLRDVWMDEICYSLFYLKIMALGYLHQTEIIILPINQIRRNRNDNPYR